MSRTLYVAGYLALATVVVLLATKLADADILVSTFNGNNVMRFEETGELSGSGQIPSGSGGLLAAAGVAIDAGGNVYASSRNTGEVIRYDASTLAPTTFIPAGTLFAPAGLHFGPANDLYVADSFGGAVRRYDGTTGAFIENVITDLFFAGGFTFAPNGDIYATDFGAGLIYRREHATGQLSLMVNMNDTNETPPGPNPGLGGRAPSGILLGSAGDVYVTDLFQNQLLHYDAAGQLIGSPVTVDIPGHPIPAEEPFPSHSPADLVFDRNGNILVANLGYTQAEPQGTLTVYDQDLNFLALLADEIPSASGLTLTPAHFVLGDLNGDNVLNNFDIQPFEKALTDTAEYLESYPVLTNFALRGDVDDNGVFNNFDIQPFEQLLTSGSGSFAAAVPEPSAIALAIAALVGVPFLRRLRSVGHAPPA